MYYTSQNKQELEAYNDMVTQGEGYNGTTKQWASIVEHKDGNQFAILKNNNYPSEMQEIELLDGWFENIDI